MIYYGIVDKIKDSHASGIYGRKQLSQEEIDKMVSPTPSLLDALNPIQSLPGLYKELKTAVRLHSIDTSPIRLLQKSEVGERRLVFDDSYLNDYYSINDNLDLFYGLFDEALIKSQAFKKIMKSGGGSQLVIRERDSIPRQMHFGGESGKFSFGLYCVHPKDNNILIPMKKFNQTIEDLILAEFILAYEALGAKRIVIQDITNVNGAAKIETNNGNGAANIGGGIKKLIDKQYELGSFDPERALKGSKFIYDYPFITDVVNARIHGNQTVDEFTKSVNVSAGLDIKVLDLFSIDSSFKYERQWTFNIEFYKKP